MEEFGELCGGVAKGKLDVIKDSIGDCFVVLVILCSQLGITDQVDFNTDDVIDEYKMGKYEYTSVTEQLLEGINSLGGLSIAVNNGWIVQKEYVELFFINLIIVALFNSLDFKDCIQYAYDRIKDRKGK
ncbi:pyrophosphatase [Pasteurella multocida]|nr:pyrophosphatase [Pasteurella multocida]